MTFIPGKFTPLLTWEVRSGASDGNGGGFRGGSNLTPPTAPVLSSSGSGSISSGTYFFVLTFSELNGTQQTAPIGSLETPFGGQQSITVGANSKITVTSPVNPFSQGSLYWNIYVSKTSGGPYLPVDSGSGGSNISKGICGTNMTLGTSDDFDFTNLGDQGPPGTDYSQQNGVQVTYTDIVIDASDNTKLTSAGNPFTVAQVGNVVNITSGTGFTVGRYEIINVSSGGAAYMSMAVGTTSSTGGHGVLGGALATPGLAAAQLENATDAGCVFIKGGSGVTYTLSGSSNVSGGRMTSDNGKALWIGYNTTRSRQNQDGNQPTLNAGADNMTLLTMTLSGHDNYVANIVFNSNGHALVTGIGSTGAHTFIRDCAFVGGLDTGVSVIKGSVCFRSYADSCTVANFHSDGPGCLFLSCMAHVVDGGFGFQLNGIGNDGSSCIHCVGLVVPTASTGGTCFQSNSSWQHFVSCTAYDQTGGGGSPSTGSVGFAVDAAGTGVYTTFANCLSVNFSGAGAYGFNFGTSSPTVSMLNCAGFNNAHNSPIVANGSVPSVQIYNFVQLTSDPFNNAAGLDFGLNNVAGGGNACRGAGTPGHTSLTQIPNLNSPSYVDIGAIQTPAAISGMLVHPGLVGGARG